MRSSGRPEATGIDPGRDWRFWGLLGLFALVLGLHLATPRLDSDQAVTGLMGQQILQGEFPIFFWSQNHAGVPESYGAAVTFFLFGLSRPTLSVVPALAALGLVLLLYRTGAVLFGPGAGLLAMLFATIVSPYVMAHYVLARAYYIEHLLLGQVVLLGAALWLRYPLSEAARARTLVAMGLAGGVGLYCGFQIVDALLPAALAMWLVDPRLPLRRGAWLGLGAFLLGSAPFWLYNITHDWATFATGTRFQGGQSAGEAARRVLLDLLPVVLGVQDYIGTPPYLPWPAMAVIPAATAAGVTILAIRVLWGLRRLRQSPELAGEALLLTALTVTIGAVWYGRFVQVPRYLIPVAPVLALILARASQLVWRRAPAGAVIGAVAYLVAVGVPLVGDLTVLWPQSRAAYWAGRAADEALFAFLRAREIDRTYAFEYWLAPRLTFDARAEIIVAEPFNDRYPPHTQAVDASPRPAYILRSEAETFENWLRGIGSGADRAQVGPYVVFWNFTAPPPIVPIPRAGWTVRTSPETGEAKNLIDGQLDSGWSSAEDFAGGASIEVDLGTPRSITGVTLITDRPRHLPHHLEVAAVDAPGRARPVSRFETGGYIPSWRNGAPRTTPSRTLMVRFPPVEARHLRLRDLDPTGIWAVTELFVLAPADLQASGGGTPLVEEGRRLEVAGQQGPALLRYRQAMKTARDDPDGYVEFARLASEIGLRAPSLVEQATRYAQLGLIDEARGVYADLAASLGPERTHVELTQRRARLAAQAGDAVEAQRLQDEADRARAPRSPVGAAFDRLIELTGYDVAPVRAHPGETVEVTYQWRLIGASTAPLMTYAHFRSERARFGDDRPLPAPILGLGDGPQHLVEHRRVVIPLDAQPGAYHIVVGVWDPESGRRVRRWWRGLLPTPSHVVELRGLEILPRR